jgi:predicted RNase H-like HicB family nuclease
MRQMELKWTITYEQSEGWWVAEIAEVPGAISQGRSKEEARENVLDALNELLTYRREAAQEKHHGNYELVLARLTRGGSLDF